jgi:glycosyltransferase involved in cell wall biosynthesis
MKERRKLNIANVGLKGIPVTIGGPENFVENIATRLVQRGHRCTVYCRPYSMKMWLEGLPPDSRPENKHVMHYRGVRLVTLPTIPRKNLDSICHTTLAVTHALFEPYDIINYHTMGSTMVSVISWLRLRQKIVVSVHGLDWARSKWGSVAQRLLKMSEYTSARFVDATQVVSHALKRYYDDEYCINSVYIPTGVDVKEPIPPNVIRKYGLEKEKYVLYLSRLVPEKGVHYLIKAFEKLNSDMKLVIAGDSLYEIAYVNQLKEMANQDVIFTGFVSDEEMSELFSNAYVYVLPSEVEGLPHSVLQGLSYGRCVVTSDIEPNREALGDCGYTFRMGDPESLRAVLQKLMDNPDLVKAEREKSVARVRAVYDWEVVVDKFEDLYYRLLGL